MKKYLLTALLVTFTTLALAAVSVSNKGTYVGEATNINLDGTFETSYDGSKVDVSIYESATDPCAVLGAKTIFFNSTTGAPCFCNNLEVDLSIYDGTTACF